MHTILCHNIKSIAYDLATLYPDSFQIVFANSQAYYDGSGLMTLYLVMVPIEEYTNSDSYKKSNTQTFT